MSNKKTQDGYIVHNDKAMFLTNNGSYMGTLGDQAEFPNSVRIKFFKTRPRAKKGLNIKVATKVGTTIDLA